MDVMKLEGVHHITAITGDAQKNVDFYVGVLGLRLVKKTVNQDDPTVYHLFFADEKGDAGSDLTFFEYPGAPQGRAGAGMIHTIAWRVGSAEALDFWAERLEANDVEVRRNGDTLGFSDPEGLAHELRVSKVDDEPLMAEHPEYSLGHGACRASTARGRIRAIPRRAGSSSRRRSAFRRATTAGRSAGRSEAGCTGSTRPPPERGLQGAGSVHHIAWASQMDDHEAWRERVIAAGARPTPVIDRFYFRSIYFREPSGVLFEIATLGPGFTVDEPLESLGEKLSLPPDYEHLREQVEPVLRPITNPRVPA